MPSIWLRPRRQPRSSAWLEKPCRRRHRRRNLPLPAETGATAERQASTGNTETTEASQDAAHARAQAATGGKRAGAVSPDCGPRGAGTG